MRATEKATADSRSVQSFAIVTNTRHEIAFCCWPFSQNSHKWIIRVRLACVQSPLPHSHQFAAFLRGRLYTGYRKRIIHLQTVPQNWRIIRRIVPDHSKLKPSHFQIKTYYLSDSNYQTDNQSHTNNPSLSAKTAISVINECRTPASSWAFSCLLLRLFTKINFKLTVETSMCKMILEVDPL